MGEAAVLSETFELKIPESVREAHHLRPGQEFAFIPRDGAIMLVPVPTFEALRGIAAGADPTGYRDRDDRY